MPRVSHRLRVTRMATQNRRSTILSDQNRVGDFRGGLLSDLATGAVKAAFGVGKGIRTRVLLLRAQRSQSPQSYSGSGVVFGVRGRVFS